MGDGVVGTGLRIAMVAPPWYGVPPQGYGGIEAMVADLVIGLHARGHEITLIGAGGTATPARFLRTFEDPPSTRIGESLPEAVQAAAAARLVAGLDVDLVHDHSLCGPVAARGRAIPTVATMHGPASGELLEYYRWLGDSVSLVAISRAQRARAPELNWAGTVHNAVQVGTFPVRVDKEDWVLWLGRFSPDKGVHQAIDVAREAGRRIVLAGKLSEPPEHEYFDRFVRPRLGPHAEYVGEADYHEKRELLSRARCLVFPIQWEEPFGIVMIEAMACGTPVVALGRGSVPEVVVDGRTGFIRRTEADLPAAVDRAHEIDPLACREHAERHFDVASMAERYERVYRDVLAARPARPDAAAARPRPAPHVTTRPHAAPAPPVVGTA
ncbi:glycosyltransferase family 4 protein [Bailinhaonella thermotolerans]|uniref:Glycosyltransferase family 4 protein n=1 Tax=Bailinhaonella thermotolerans TaxID=1070861 RepID=A0A3A4AEF9_9ACTN|nr:glycosyltransferase family 4 protein [Bailinhaonella thermotolerans]RJL25114.1 glycosyltransferase family 4 protein [Bailinhaonella thermotolerans]